MAPGHGTKVDLGRNAPVKDEAAGPVGSESLAAQSYREGGGFESNVGSQPENLSASDYKKSSGATKLEAAPDAEHRERAQAGKAPSHISSQSARDTSGPHGKNIHEGFDDSGVKDGLKAALASEPGSEDDPSRLAEQRFEINQNATTVAGGPRETRLKTETKYDALGDTEA